MGLSFLLFCLFSTFLLANPWMDELIKQEFLSFKEGISHEALEETWKHCSEDLFERFRVIKGIRPLSKLHSIV